MTVDAVRAHLTTSLLPRLADDGTITLPVAGLSDPSSVISIAPARWAAIAAQRSAVASELRATSEQHATARRAATRVLHTRALAYMWLTHTVQPSGSSVAVA